MLAAVAAINGKVGACVGYGLFALVVAVATEPRARRLVRLHLDFTSPETVAMSMALVGAVAAIAAAVHLTAVLRGHHSSAAHVIASLLLVTSGPYLAVAVPWELRKRRRAGETAVSLKPDEGNADEPTAKDRATDRDGFRPSNQVADWSEAERRRQLTFLVPAMFVLVFVLVFAAVLVGRA